MKYKPSISLCHLLGKYLHAFTVTKCSPDEWDIIVPVPSSAAGTKKRMFQQCGVLASYIPWGQVAHNALSFSRPSPPQASLSTKERLRNRHHVFEVQEELVHEKRILLLDDVITTGATITSAAQALFQSGALRLQVLALARSPQWHRHNRRRKKLR